MTKWHKCARTEVGHKCFSYGFMYCRVLDNDKIVFSDGALTWVTLKKQWAKLMFVCLEQQGDDISDAIEATYQQSLYRDSK